MAKMMTYRLVVQNVSPDGQNPGAACQVAIDICVRGQPDLAFAHINDVVRRFLSLDFYGSWVDQGTDRITYTVGVTP